MSNRKIETVERLEHHIEESRDPAKRGRTEGQLELYFGETATNWVLQESLLAPRTVHMINPVQQTMLPVVWECREMMAKRLLSKFFVFPAKDLTKIWSSGLWRRDCPPPWNQTAETYSECLLYEPSDKIVVIAGLVRIFSLVMNDGYIARLWSQHLGQGLT